ncbi:hypothetical protein SANT12839_014520 [Streptomyces antimycoticus]|uniref:Uncharacterized protein n=1 Tax=Streptomyces antimycoticus TaxID=68175 RepID=A0A4D4K0G8_9ACTN|nr:hypothetical protein SANT12839_014520 [Streptomyces antimycoticus]
MEAPPPGTAHLLEERDRRATLAALTVVTSGPAPALLPHPPTSPLTERPTPSSAAPQPVPTMPLSHPPAAPLIADTPPPAATMAG